jgi:hypothetical protein
MTGPRHKRASFKDSTTTQIQRENATVTLRIALSVKNVLQNLLQLFF